MTKRYRSFVVAVEGLSTPVEAVFSAWLNEVGLQWWHYISCNWLVVGETDLDTEALRDKLRELVPTGTVLVLEPKGPCAWAALSPKQIRARGGKERSNSSTLALSRARTVDRCRLTLDQPLW